MFTVRRIGGEVIPYTSGIINSKRRVQAVTSTERVTSIASSDSSSDANAIKGYQDSQDKNRSNQPRRKLILAKDLMTSPVFTISADTSLQTAWEITVTKRFRHLLVRDSNNKLAGLVSDRDLLKHIVEQNKTGTMLPISKIMHSEILTASPETEIREIAKVMFEEHIGCIPIVTEDHKLSGIITRSDILRALLVKAPLELWI